jgi:hypothetical protein
MAKSGRVPSSTVELGIKFVQIAGLHSNDSNARTHSARQLRQIARSIERFGFTNPVLIATCNNKIICGHGRVAAAQLLGLLGFSLGMHPAFEPCLHQRRSPPPGNAILRGRDKGPERPLEIQSTDCGDKMHARIAASSGLFATNREISVCARLHGGGRSRSRTSLCPIFPC